MYYCYNETFGQNRYANNDQKQVKKKNKQEKCESDTICDTGEIASP